MRSSRPSLPNLGPPAPDPRESEDWFLRLPAAQQQSARERWAFEERRQLGWDELRTGIRRSAVRDGAVIFVVCQVLQPGWSVGSLLAAFAVGASLGYAWGIFHSERFARAVSMSVTWFCVQFAGGVASTDPLAMLMMLCGALLASSLAGITGLMAETRWRDE